MSRKVIELPGFYYDPEKRRHFRIQPDRPRPPPVSKSKKPKISEPVKPVIPVASVQSVNSLPKKLHQRAIGNILFHDFVTDIIYQKLKQPLYTETILPRNYVNCNFNQRWKNFKFVPQALLSSCGELLIFCEPKADYCQEFHFSVYKLIWNAAQQRMNIMYCQSWAELFPFNNIAWTLCSFKGEKHTLLTGYNGCISQRPLTFPSGNKFYPNFGRYGKDIWSLEYQDDNFVAFGGENVYGIYDMVAKNDIRHVGMPGRVQVIAASPHSRSLLVCGSNIGNLNLFDIRSKRFEKWKTPGKSFVCGACWLPNEHYIAVHTYGGLIIYDIRKCEKLLCKLEGEGLPGCYFPAAVRCTQLDQPWLKETVSSWDWVLSAAGLDGAVRLWSAKDVLQSSEGFKKPLAIIEREQLMVDSDAGLGDTSSSVPWHAFRSRWRDGGPPGVLTWLPGQPISFTNSIKCSKEFSAGEYDFLK